MATSVRMLLSERAAAAPNAVAITAGPTNITWTELQRRALRVASALVRDGIGVQTRVAYLGKTDARYFELLFGCGLAAAVLAPLNWRLAPAELEAILLDSGASLLFVDPDVSGPGVRGGSVRIVELGSTYEAWLGPEQDPAIPAEPDQIAFQLYTSGTTGRPKGAMFANGTNFRVLTEKIAGAWFEAGDVSLVAMPLFHMGGLAWALSGMASGVRNVIIRDFVAADLLDTVLAEGTTVAFCVPAMLAMLCDALEAQPRDLPLKRFSLFRRPDQPEAADTGDATAGLRLRAALRANRGDRRFRAAACR